MARCDVVDMADNFLVGFGVDDDDLASDAGKGEHGLDILIVLLLSDERKQHFTTWLFIPFDNLQSDFMQRNDYGLRVILAGFSWNVMQLVANDIIPSEAHQIADTAADEALENEDIALARKTLGIEIKMIEMIAFLDGEKIWRAKSRLGAYGNRRARARWRDNARNL